MRMLYANLCISLYICRWTSFQYSNISVGVINITEISIKNTHKMTVLVLLITESFVKSSHIISDCGNAWKNAHRFIFSLSTVRAVNFSSTK